MTPHYTTLDAIMRARRSCRAFLPRSVPTQDIERIVATAGQVPSWGNAPPWQLEITRGDATDRFRAALQDAVTKTTPAPDLSWPSSYSGIYRDRRRVCGFQLYDAVGIEKSDRVGRMQQMLRNYAFFDAPHVAIVSSPTELGPYGAMDSGGFVTAFTLAATALGIATIPQAAIAGYAPLLREHLGLGEDRLILCAISLGYADKDHPANSFQTERATPDDIIDWAD